MIGFSGQLFGFFVQILFKVSSVSLLVSQTLDKVVRGSNPTAARLCP